MKSKNYCKPPPSCRIFALHLRCITLANGSEPVTLLLRFGYAFKWKTNKKGVRDERLGVRSEGLSPLASRPLPLNS